MDQIKIGKFIAECRKKNNLTQMQLAEKLKWWDKSIEEINSLIPLLTSSDLNNVKEELSKLV